MDNRFRRYTVIWAISLAAFNAVCFIPPAEINGFNRYTGLFWVCYAFITIAFAGHLLSVRRAFQAADLKRLFYNMPLITLSVRGLAVMLIFGAAAMIVPGIPTWVGAIVCVLVLAFTASVVSKADWAAEEVEKIDVKIENKTNYIRELTTEAQGLISLSNDDRIKAACKKVYEAVRFSDPMSDDSLKLIEAQMTVKMDELSKAVSQGDPVLAESIAKECLQLVEERNRRCKEGRRS